MCSERSIVTECSLPNLLYTENCGILRETKKSFLILSVYQYSAQVEQWKRGGCGFDCFFETLLEYRPNGDSNGLCATRLSNRAIY